MRYDKQIELIYKKQATYNPTNPQVESATSSLVMANVTDMTDAKQAEIFGSIMPGIKVIRVRRYGQHIPKKWNYCRIDGTEYVKKSSIKSAKGYAYTVQNQGGYDND